ncbi:alpha/beta hydrolase family protein [Lacibacterium aquatile]|uniref:Alpha/beta hydrolase family protein n=1 Tax=Lacibacterium aquatile TaxID=1168082 RepID=A0ABW5DS64_9PROT
MSKKLAFAALLGGVAVTAQAQTTAEVRPPNPAQVVAIPAPASTVQASSVPTQLVTFYSKLSNESKNQIEGWVWKPAVASASARVPLLIVAHGHSGAGTYANPSTQFKTLAKQMTDLGIGVMLVNSFSASRNAYVLANYASNYAIIPGLGSFRPVEASDHLVRPWDVVGAAEYAAKSMDWVDGNKLVGIGYSHGGTAFLGAAMSNHPVNLSNPQGGGRLFKKIFITYPGCGMSSPNNYKNSAAVVPAVIGIGSDDTSVSPSYCTGRQAESVAAAATNPSLYAFEYWLYKSAGHTWESTVTTPNLAAKFDWRTKVATYMKDLKNAP